MMEIKNGLSPPSVVERFHQLSNLLTENKYIVKYITTDGDISFDALHDDFFNTMIEKF